MATLSTTPTYPAPNRQTAVAFTLTESGANFVRVWCTDAPLGSSLRAKIDGTSDPRNRVEVYAGDGGNSAPWREYFDVGGAYQFVAQEYTLGASDFGGGYEDDPEGAPDETKVGSEAALTLYVGQRMTSEIRAGSDSVTLVAWVWNDAIRATSIAVHGEETPALISTSPTARALAAMESSAVRAALAALAADGTNTPTVATITGTPSSILANAAGGFIKEWNEHIADASSHDDADTHNSIPVGLASASSAANLKDTVNEILPFIRWHFLNDAIKGGSTSGRDSANFHSPSSSKTNDNANLPLISSVGSEQDAYWALAELWRCYEAHRVSTSVHNPADTTNTLTALPLLLQVALQVFTVWASTSPTTPATQSSGAMILISKAGFSETPLES